MSAYFYPAGSSSSLSLQGEVASLQGEFGPLPPPPSSFLYSFEGAAHPEWIYPSVKASNEQKEREGLAEETSSFLRKSEEAVVV